MQSELFGRGEGARIDVNREGELLTGKAKGSLSPVV